MKSLFIILAFSLPVFAQPASFSAGTGAITLVATATKATLQQPATNAEQIAVDSATIVCPASCIITQYQNGTAATTTAGTVVGIQPNGAATFALNFFTASNVGNGTVIGAVTVCSAACTRTLTNPIGGPILTMGTTGTATNYTIGVSAVTGDVYITFTGRRLQ